MSEADLAVRFSSYVRRVMIALGLAATLVVLLIVIWQVGQALLVIFASCLFAIFLSGCASWISRNTPVSYRMGLWIVVLVLVAITAAAASFLGVRLGQQATQLYQGLLDMWQQAESWIRQFGWGKAILQQAEDDQLQFRQWTASAMRILRGALGGTALGVLIIVIGFYLAGTPDSYKRGVLRLVPMANRPRASEVLDAVGRALQGWLLAQFVSMAVIGTLVAVGLWLFGIELWLILGLLAGVLTFIPNLGPILAGIPPLLLALNQSVWLAAGVLAYFTAVQMLEGYLVTPMVQHRVIRLPPAAILSIQLLMAYAFGMLGVAVAAPLLAALMVVVEMLYIQDLLGDRHVRITGQEHRLWS